MIEEDFILKEYEALRSEIIDRSKRENNSLLWSATLLLAIFGTISDRTEVISVIPLAFSFFGYIWIENSLTIHIIGKYIRTKIEDKIFKDLNSEKYKEGWENFIKDKQYDFKTSSNSFFVIPILYFGLISIAAITYQIIFFINQKESESNKLLPFSVVLNLLIYIVYFIYWIRSRKYRKTFN